MLTPDILFDSYRDITPAFLQGQGVTLLLTDLDATCESDPAAASKEEILFAYPGLFAIFVYRVAHELYLRQIPMIPRIMSEYAHSRTGIEIHPGAQIGAGARITT